MASARLTRPGRAFRWPARGVAACAVLVCASLAAAVPAPDPALETAELAPLAARSLLLDIADSSQRAVVVGERGHVLVSESRADWRQVEGVPTRATLTAVHAVDGLLWAVGHAQVILHSADGGVSWQRQYADPYDPEDFDDIANGAPLLDVLFVDAQHGIAVGAYGLMLDTADGGLNWTRRSIADATRGDPAVAKVVVDARSSEVEPGEHDPSEDEDSWLFSDEDLELEELTDPHLNAITRTGSGAFFMVAERGSAFRSRDQGASWERLTIPYAGSMFGVLGFDGDHVLVFGLRGNAFESRDLGTTWTRVDTGTEQTLQGGAVLDAQGGAVLVGSNGVVLVRRSAEEAFTVHQYPPGGVLANVLPIGGASDLIVVGEGGIGRFSPN